VKKEIEFDAEALVGSVEAMAAHVQGKRKLTMRTKTLRMPRAVVPMRSREVAAIRRQLNVSQSVFAALLNVPKVTAVSWEKGRRRPTGAALRLLDLIRRKPGLLEEA
jgi:putative transcriptional regulator